ncbi:hypothetical protein RU97_GL000199 [Enterococcus canis]|uniref:bis(5'-nucleosyl)-tetraphosphatase (symmetrical) n=1 Tax=Enterococcus canis TaxID=214095 RepID=A0A1L8RJM5_9ENTE|nr:bis(5'-nucleosyl)-tetraphosphatase (symmetrical) YqeK [Enterococcus canis]OJG19966.1 hypothetical protein RU97_GL000199 [Enterococcus canis]
MELLIRQVTTFLTEAGLDHTLRHSLAVAKEAATIAQQYRLDPNKAYVAGLLHDISAVIPNDERLLFQQNRSELIYPAERTLPMLLHQRQSAIIAKETFGIQDGEILEAISCHTTLRDHATPLDLCLFVADKIKWDRSEPVPYLTEIEAALENSLTSAARVYFAWGQHDFQVLHPWARAAMCWLERQAP